MSVLNIANIVTISVAAPPAGLADYQINNLAILTKESPLVSLPLGYGIYLSPSDVATDWGSSSEVFAMANLIFSQTPNILNGGGSLIIFAQGSGETLDDAITRCEPLIFFGGILWAGYAPDDAEVIAAAAVVQPMQKMLFASDYLTAAMDPGGLFYVIRAANQIYTRCLLYTPSAAAARLMAAAYAGRSMSTAFDGSNTTLTMQLKDLIGILPDPGITQTNLNTAETIGVDLYVSVPIPKVFSTGGSGEWFYDRVYNLTWFVFALRVAGFNALATTSTKVPQTEPGIATLRNAYLSVIKQAVNNGYIAPGAWNSPELFGDPAALIRNVLQTGFYIFSQPVNQQSQTDRAARKAPLIQIAIKEAGAVHSSAVIVNVNA